MQSKRSVRSAILLTALVGLVAGCGTALDGTFGALQATGTRGARTAVGATAKGDRQAHGIGGLQGMGPDGCPFLDASLSLTDAQKTSLKAIQDKYRPAAKPTGDATGRDAQRDSLNALMTADTVDQSALKVALAAMHAARPTDDGTRLTQEVTMLAEIRDVLTAEQRDIVANLPKPAAPPSGTSAAGMAPPAGKPPHVGMAPPPGGSPFGPFPIGKLTLTDAQKALFEAAKPAGQPPIVDRGAAVAAYMRTGDQAALKAALQPPADVAPAFDGLVTAFASLTREQRTQLTAVAQGGHGRPDGHGGPGGRMGMGGPGGRGPRPIADVATTVSTGMGQ
ncbi:MAG: Spy/CpxP family protein refolding chaperone [Candidatus Sericytochromatia bacterium]|nr:Spy/CpxP family protein refolding chaperone [Candidatus Sericytochromatia bacterium]